MNTEYILHRLFFFAPELMFYTISKVWKEIAHNSILKIANKSFRRSKIIENVTYIDPAVSENVQRYIVKNINVYAIATYSGVEVKSVDGYYIQAIVSNIVSIHKSMFDPSEHFNSLFAIAVRKGHLELLKYLFARNATNRHNIYYYNFVYWIAAKKGNLDIIKFLVEQTSIDDCDYELFCDFPLLLAVRYGHDHIVKYLVELYSNREGFYEYANVPLLIKTAQASGNTKIINYLTKTFA